MFRKSQSLIAAVSSSTRQLLVLERTRAMRGGVSAALRRLKQRVLKGTSDEVACAMLRAELAFIDRRPEEAIDIVRTEVVPLFSAITTEQQFVIEENFAALQISAFHPDSLTYYYHAADRRHDAGFEWPSGAEVADLLEQGKDRDAIAALTEDLIHSYYLGCWQVARRTHAQCAKAWLKIGAIEEAFFYAITSLDKRIAEQVGDTANALRRSDIGGKLVDRAVRDANLTEHFNVACAALIRFREIIPDDTLPILFSWLIQRCRELWIPGGSMAAAWTVLTVISHRLPPDLGVAAADCILTHSSFTEPIPAGKVRPIREEMVKTLTAVIDKLSGNFAARITNALLRLASENNHQDDYRYAINLLCHIGQRRDLRLKDLIGNALFPDGIMPNRILLQVAHLFGKNSFSPADLNSWCIQLAREVQSQVQYAESEAGIREVPETVMRFHAESSGQYVVAYLVEASGLDAIIRLQGGVDHDNIVALLRAMIEMIANTDNPISNRVSLATRVTQLSDRVGVTVRDELFTALAPLARGEIKRSKIFLFGQDQDPLSRFRVNLGDASDLQAVSIISLAAISQGINHLERDFTAILDAALTDRHPKIRYAAYAAAKHCPRISADTILSVLMGTRDTDSGAAIMAFATLAERKEWKLTTAGWRLFLVTTRLAINSSESKLRAVAAFAVARRIKKVPPTLRRDFQEILHQFSCDAAASVRTAASRS